MPFDDQLTTVLDGVLKSIREHLDDDFRALAQQLSERAAAERSRVAAEAADAAAADVRQQMQLQMAQLRDATQRQIDDMRRATQQQIEQARQAGAQELEDARRAAQAQVDDAQRLMDLRVAAAEERARAARTTPARDVAQGVASIDEGRTLGDVLERLAQAAAAHAQRAALLIVRNAALQEWRRVGFADAASRAEVPLAGSGLVADAVASGRMARTEGQPVPDFAGGAADRDAVACPVIVGGQVVAVVYGDAAHQAEGAAQWPAMVDVLARYASRVLETMTIRQATGLAATPGVTQGGTVREV